MTKLSFNQTNFNHSFHSSVTNVDKRSRHKLMCRILFGVIQVLWEILYWIILILNRISKKKSRCNPIYKFRITVFISIVKMNNLLLNISSTRTIKNKPGERSNLQKN